MRASHWAPAAWTRRRAAARAAVPVTWVRLIPKVECLLCPEDFHVIQGAMSSGLHVCCFYNGIFSQKDGAAMWTAGTQDVGSEAGAHMPLLSLSRPLELLQRETGLPAEGPAYVCQRRERTASLQNRNSERQQRRVNSSAAPATEEECLIQRFSFVQVGAESMIHL